MKKYFDILVENQFYGTAFGPNGPRPPRLPKRDFVQCGFAASGFPLAVNAVSAGYSDTLWIATHLVAEPEVSRLFTTFDLRNTITLDAATRHLLALLASPCLPSSFASQRLIFLHPARLSLSAPLCY